MNSKLIGTVVTTAVLAAGGCGGASPLSRADFIREANAICAQRTASVAKAQANQASYRAAMTEALPAMTASVERLSTLTPPTHLKNDYNRFIEAEKARIEQLKRSLAGQLTTRGSHPDRSGERLRAHVQLARDMGLASCE